MQISQLDANGRLSGKQITALVEANAGHADYRANERYYEGDAPTIIDQDKHDAPDKRIPIPFARKATNTVAGYMFKPGNISYVDTGEPARASVMERVAQFFTRRDTKRAKESQYKKLVDYLFDLNDEALVTAECAIEALRQGRGYEIHWYEYTPGATDQQTDRQDAPQFAFVPAREMVIVWSGDIKPRMSAAIRHYSQTGVDPDGNTTPVKVAEIYYPTEVVVYRKAKDQEQYTLDSEWRHAYGEVPVVEHVINSEKRNLFYHVLAMVDEIDSLYSANVGNELASIAMGILTMSRSLDDTITDAAGDTQQEKFFRTKILDDIIKTEGDFVEWVVKNVNSEFVFGSSDRLERLVYEMLQIPNFNDEKFNTASGVAIAYKLIDFENLCAMIEAYFEKGLRKRLRLIRTITGEHPDYRAAVAEETYLDIAFARNLPRDLVENADVAQKLSQLIPKKRLYRLFPQLAGDADETYAELKAEQTDIVDITEPLEPGGDDE